jgi:hypothetical protein
VVNFIKAKEYNPDSWPKKLGDRTLKSEFVPEKTAADKEAAMLRKQPWRSDDWYVSPDSMEYYYTYARPEFEMRQDAKQAAIDAMRERQGHRDMKKSQALLETLQFVFLQMAFRLLCLILTLNLLFVCFSAQTIVPEVDDALSLGLDFASGLVPPSISLPEDMAKMPDTIQGVVGLSSAANIVDNSHGHGSEGIKKKKVLFDENRLVKKKFKTSPATQAEMKDCEVALSPVLLQVVQAGPKLIDFGKVCVTSKNFKSFSISNGLEQYILANVGFAAIPELAALSTPPGQVIPAGAMAGFDVGFTSDVVTQEYRKVVSYSINSQHQYSFTVVAQVIPIYIQLSTTDLGFVFERSNLTSQCSQTLKLTNTVNAPAEFSFTALPASGDAKDFNGEESAFIVNPPRGVIEVGKSITVKVTYRARPSASEDSLDGILLMQTVGGEDQKVEVHADIIPSPCQLNEKKLMLGTIAVGTNTERTVTLKNVGPSYTVFRLDQCPPAVKVSPDRGFLDSGESVELTLTVTPGVAETFDGSIAFDIRGAPLTLLGLAYDAIIPDVQLLADEIDFGEVTTGISQQLPLTLENNSKIAATLYFDMSSFPDFDLIYAKVGGGGGDDDEASRATTAVSQPDGLAPSANGGPLVPVPSVIKVSSSEARKQRASAQAALLQSAAAAAAALPAAGISAPPTPATHSSAASPTPSQQSERVASGLSVGRSPSQSEAGDEDDESAYKITLPPGSRLEAQLQYAPTHPAEHAMELPLYLAGVPQYVPLRRVLHAIAVPARVTLRPLAVDFKNRVVFKKEMITGAYSISVSMTNEEANTVQWALKAAQPQVFAREGEDGEGEEKEVMQPEIGVAMGGTRVYPVAPMSPVGSSRSSTSAGSSMFLHNTWKVEPASGFLPPHEQIKVTITFIPCDPHRFILPLQLMLDGSDSPYCQFNATGAGIFPLLRFDRTEVVMPVVPLGIRSVARFHIRNYGYTNLELKYKLPADTARVPLTIRFPDGIMLGAGKDVLPVEVSFMSKKPLSFTANIDIMDNAGNKFSIPVTGTTDNSLLTVQPFLDWRDIELRVPSEKAAAAAASEAVAAAELARAAGPQPPTSPTASSGSATGAGIQLIEVTSASKKESLLAYEAVQNSVPMPVDDEEDVEVAKKPGKGMIKDPADEDDSGFDAMEAENSAYEASALSAGALIDFLDSANLMYIRRRDREFPYEFVSVNGKNAFDLLEYLSGKKVFVKEKAEAGSKKDPAAAKKDGKKEEAVKLLKQYEDCLTFLKQHGALLNTVRADYLLSFVQYQRVLATRREPGVKRSKAEIKRQKAQLEKTFPSQSREAWLCLMYQMVKTFVLSRVTAKSFKALPGLDPSLCIVDTSATASNIFSTPESILLKWLTLHHNKVHPTQPRRVTNFGADLRDGIVLCSLIRSHVPTIKACGKVGPPANSATAPGTNPVVDEATCRDNCTKLSAALTELGLQWPLNDRYFLRPTARGNVLLALYLYQSLPAYVPKAQIEFTGRLADEVVKTIELSNPTKKVIIYTVRIEGCSDFTTDQKEVRLEPRDTPGSSVAFPIRFKSRFSKQVEARIFFISKTAEQISAAPATLNLGAKGAAAAASPAAKKDRPASAVSGPKNIPPPIAATLVFVLKSNVTSRKSSKTTNVTTKLYEMQPVDVDFVNPFTSDCTFVVSAIQTPPPPVSLAAKKGKDTKADAKNQPKSPSSRPETRGLPKLPDAFFCKQDIIKVKAGASMKLNSQFLPFLTGEHKCQLVLLDEAVGEFMIDFVGTAERPVVTETFRWSIENRTSIPRDFAVPFRNAQLDKARALVVDRMAKGAAQNKERELLRLTPYPSPCTYLCEWNSPFYSCPSEFQVSDGTTPAAGGAKPVGATPGPVSPAPVAAAAGGKDAKAGGPAGANASTKFNLTLSPKGAGTYPCEIILQSAFDVRIYRIEFEILSPGTQATLEMAVPARQKITQDIPMVNPSDKDWTFSATLTGAAYSGPRELIVKKKSSATYPLLFAPAWVGEQTGTLVLQNTKTGEKATYDLVGTAEEPLADDHAVIECQARTQVQRVFTVKNPEKVDQVFTVESDLPFISGDASIKVPAGGKADYTLTLNPQLGGTYNGSISFIPPTGRFVWHAVEVQASAPAPESTIEIRSFLRKAVAVEIGITNPLNVPVEFRVQLEGEGLFGDAQIALGARETKQYEFMFSPLTSGSQMGSVSFTNAKVGEFWYQLQLIAEKAPPTILPDMRAEVGRDSSTMIVLENPSDQEIELTGIVSNARNFKIEPKTVTIAGYQSVEVKLSYMPSELSVEQACDVMFRHPSAGEWLYKVQGVGVAPSSMQTIEISTPLYHKSTNTIPFRNPFDTPLEVKVSMSNATLGNTYALFLKKAVNAVPAGALFQCVFTYAPNAITESTCNITIESTDASRPLRWQYLIKGVAEAPTTEDRLSVKCRARKRLESSIELSLTGLGDGLLSKPETLSFELVMPDADANFLRRCLALQLLTNQIVAGNDKVHFAVQFEPLRPVRATLGLIVKKQSGGRWRYDLEVEAEDPEIDDVIRIQSPIHKTTSVSFRLTNQFDAFADYKAYFSRDSPFEFAVAPPMGVLPPYGHEGTQFVVSFTPHEYGKILVGRLIIQTEDMQWTYEVRGTHPHFVAPQAISTVDDRLPKELEAKLSLNKKSTTNYMQQNMLTVKQSNKQATIKPQPPKAAGRR